MVIQTVFVFDEKLEISICPTCNGKGNMIAWNRRLQKFAENKDYPCETCNGAKYIVVSHWKKEM